CRAIPTAPVPTSLPPCWVHTPPLRVNTHTAPGLPLLSVGPPTMAVLPSADTAAEEPCAAFTDPPAPTSLGPCLEHTPPLRVNTHAAPAWLLSNGPPTMAVLPSSDTATELPCWAFPTASLATSLGPCCTKSASAGCAGQSSVAAIAAMAPPRPGRARLR